MVELAVHHEPLHQVDVLQAGGAGAAQGAAPLPRDVRTGLSRPRANASIGRGTVGVGVGWGEGGYGEVWVRGVEGWRSNTESGFEDVDS